MFYEKMDKLDEVEKIFSFLKDNTVKLFYFILFKIVAA